MMDSITLELVALKFQRLCSKSKRYPGVKAVTRDPSRENGLIYNTDLGVFRGKVWEENDNLVFQIGNQELLIRMETFLGPSH